MFSRQSSVKVMSSSENLAEQLVVWLTSQGKRSMSLKKKKDLYSERNVEAMSSFSPPQWFTCIFTHSRLSTETSL